MGWIPPRSPSTDYDSIVAYWRAILEIPLSEVGAEMLRDIASQRLAELRAKEGHRGNQHSVSEK